MRRRQSLANEFSATFARVFAYLGALALLSVGAAHIFDSVPVVAASEPAPRSEWTEIERPHPAFALSIPEAADAPSSYSIRRHAGGGRKDILVLGEPNGGGPYLRVEIYRPGSEAVRFDDGGSEIAARAGELGQADAVRMQPALDSKFGPLMLVDFVVKDAPPRHCLGFARNYDEPRLQLSGWFCQSGRAIERATLTCALDRLTLISAGSEQKVAALFAKAEINRTFCGSRNSLLAATPKHRVLWEASEQKLRGRIQ